MRMPAFVLFEHREELEVGQLRMPFEVQTEQTQALFQGLRCIGRIRIDLARYGQRQEGVRTPIFRYSDHFIAVDAVAGLAGPSFASDGRYDAAVPL